MICTPTIERINVDLPQPLGPRRPVTDPEPTSSDKPPKISRPPRTTVRSETTMADESAFTVPTLTQADATGATLAWASVPESRQSTGTGTAVRVPPCEWRGRYATAREL